MTGGKQVTSTTYLRHLSFSVIRKLCNLLDPDELWMRLVVNIPKKLDDPSFGERYTQAQIRMFEDRGKKIGGSATNSVLQDWFTQNSQVRHLLKALCDAQLYAAADYISVDILKGDKVPRIQNDGNSMVVNVNASELPKPPGPKAQNLDKSMGPNKPDLYPDKITLPPEKLDSGFKPSKKQPVESEIRERKEQMQSYGDHAVLMDRMQSHDSGVPSPDLQCAPGFPKYHHPKQVESDECASACKQEPSEHEEKPLTPGSQVISYNTLRHYTNNFDSRDISEGGSVIGCGGFGTVFLGTFPNGYKVAVKVLKMTDENQELTQKQFETELRSLTEFRHKNIVLLLGYSADGPSKCLVYEYMPNGSLEDRLCCFNGTPPLPWHRRIEIAQGTARGISYLNGRGVVHRDIKSANVLLDDDFTPKVGDFATVRMAPSGAGSTIVETTLVIGTSAYMAPEAIRFDISAKLDSFAFGVVLLELLTGLPPNDTKREEADLWSYVQENCDDSIIDLLDKNADSWDHSVANALFGVAKKCLYDRKKARSLISDVLPELEGLLL